MSLLRGMMAGVFAGGGPVILDLATTSFGTSTGTHNVPMPAVVNAGDLLVMCITARSINSSLVIGNPSGWTSLGELIPGSGATTHVEVFYKVAVGNEDGTNVNVTTNVAAHMAAIRFRIAAGNYVSVPTTTTAVSVTSGLTIDPPSHNSGGSGSTLFIAGFGSNGTASPDVYSLANNQTTVASGGTEVCRFIMSTSIQPAGVFDPPTYTMASNTHFAAYTISIRSA